MAGARALELQGPNIFAEPPTHQNKWHPQAHGRCHLAQSTVVMTSPPTASRDNSDFKPTERRGRWEGHPVATLRSPQSPCNTLAWKVPCWSINYRANCWLWLQTLCSLPQCGAPPIMGSNSLKLLKCPYGVTQDMCALQATGKGYWREVEC